VGVGVVVSVIKGVGVGVTTVLSVEISSGSAFTVCNSNNKPLRAGARLWIRINNIIVNLDKASQLFLLIAN
jgi:hypothetical protein